MLTKQQKIEQVAQGKKLVEASENLIFADFTGVPTKLVNKLKKDLKASGGTYRVFKKRLMRIVMQEAGHEFDPTQFDSQVGVIAIPGELSGSAGAIYKFTKEVAKEKKEFKVLGAYDISARTFLTAEQFIVIAKLPTREVLLAMVLGAITGPLRVFMYVLQERQKKMVEAK